MTNSYSTQGEPSLEQLINVVVENPNNDEAVLYEDGMWKNKAILTPSSLPSGSSGDVIISDGTGIVSTSKLNVNPSNGNITGDYIKVDNNTIKLGYQAGFGANNGSVSIGTSSGITAGNNSVSLGKGAVAVDNNSIVINASPSTLLSSFASSCYIDPLRDITVGSLPGLPFIVHYDDSTKEMFKAVDLQTRNAYVKGFLTVDSTASIYGGQLKVGTVDVGNKIVAGGGNNNLVVDLTNQRVAINKANPDEELDINGTLRIEADTTQTIRFYDTQGGGTLDENGRIEITQDAGGGEMKFYTLQTGGGTPTERLSINRHGALGLSGNYGTSGQVLSSNGTGSAVSWIDVPISQPKIMFHGTFNNKQKQSNTALSEGGVKCCDGFNTNRFPPVGGGWDAGTGIFTAPRDCYMNFCWQALMYSNAGQGTNNMEGVLIHKIPGTPDSFKYVRAQWISSYNDTQNQLQASPCVSAVLYMKQGETVRPGATSSADWRWYSLGFDTNVSFSGHNCD